jgi:methyl-accepting chemotaxis protein
MAQGNEGAGNNIPGSIPADENLTMMVGQQLVPCHREQTEKIARVQEVRMSNSQVKLFASIQFKVIIITIAVITTILGCFAAVDIALKNTRMQQELTRSTEIVAQRLADNLKLPLWDLSQEAIEDALTAELLVPDVYAVAVYDYDKSGHKLFAGRKRDANWQVVGFDGYTPPDAVKQVLQINYHGEQLGRVEVYLSPRFKNEELLASMRNLALAVVLVDLSIFAVLWLVFRLILINPISYLSTVAEKISLGQFDQDLRFDNRNDEIGMIAQAIGRMQVSLSMAIRRLNQMRPATAPTKSR